MFIASGQQASMTQHYCMHEVPKIATLIRMTVVCGPDIIGSIYRPINPYRTNVENRVSS